jgi:hypothetical protein
MPMKKSAAITVVQNLAALIVTIPWAVVAYQTLLPTYNEWAMQSFEFTIMHRAPWLFCGVLLAVSARKYCTLPDGKERLRPWLNSYCIALLIGTTVVFVQRYSWRIGEPIGNFIQAHLVNRDYHTLPLFENIDLLILFAVAGVIARLAFGSQHNLLWSSLVCCALWGVFNHQSGYSGPDSYENYVVNMVAWYMYAYSYPIIYFAGYGACFLAKKRRT